MANPGVASGAALKKNEPENSGSFQLSEKG